MSKIRNSIQDWDPMQEEYDNSTYDHQYDDDTNGGGVQLNHNILYVTNIPLGLTREGLKTVFSRYGTLIRVYLSVDPNKRYALITFDSPNEAKLAMMKLNHAAPLNLNINISHASNKKKDYNSSEGRDRRTTHHGKNSLRSDNGSNGSYGGHNRSLEEAMADGENDMEYTDEDFGLEAEIDTDLHLELERLRLEHLKLQEAQVQCKQRMLLLNTKKTNNLNTNPTRSILPDGRIVVRNVFDKLHNRIYKMVKKDSDQLGAGAGDSENATVCTCKAKEWWEVPCSDDGTSTPSTCVLCSEERSDTRTNQSGPRTDKFDTNRRTNTSHKRTDTKYGTNVESKSVASKLTDGTSKKSVSKVTENTSKASGVISKRVGKVFAQPSAATCEFKYCDLYSDDDVDDTSRLIDLRCTDYLGIVEDCLRVIVALAGYPRLKMRLRQMELFKKSLNDIMDMQLKAGLLKNVPTFLDYYLNRGAVVCVCKDLETRDWLVRVSAGLQERMSDKLILLKAKVKRLCLAVLRIPQTSWPTTAHDAFKLLQYFNPTLRTHMWRIYSQKTIDNEECTSFILDRVSAEIVRGPSFKNIIDYKLMEFELTGFIEIYYECLLSDLDEDLRSVASRVKLLEELRSNDSTPRNAGTAEVETMTIGTKKDEQEKNMEDRESFIASRDVDESTSVSHEVTLVENETAIQEIKKDLEKSVQKDVLRKLKDAKYISDKDEIIAWTDVSKDYESEQDVNVQTKEKTNCDFSVDSIDVVKSNDVSKSTYINSEYNESFNDSFDNLNSRNSNVNIDSNRGMAYYRRTNYLHIDNELKTAVTLAGYPENKLEGTHIRRLKQLYREYFHKDIKSQRFANLIVPKFQDVYLSNGAVIYICDSLETREYLTEVLPKLINATGLKLVFRHVKDLVRYTRVVMRLPEQLAHVESTEILHKIKDSYPNLKPDCWKCYSDVAGKQKRQFGVDPESLNVLRGPDFSPVYNGEAIIFRIIDRRKRDVSFEVDGPTKASDIENVHDKKFKEVLLKNMYCPIDPEFINTPLTVIRTNHYIDLIPDDWKLYVGPSNYPETRIDETLFHSIKRTFESIVFNTFTEANLDSIPKIHDMYLFDGVIFIICKDIASRKWLEDSLKQVNSIMQMNFKATEYRGAVGIVSMAVRTNKNADEVIDILQKQNPRLRTKFWRKISTVQTNSKLDVVLQIDKLSAQVVKGEDFNKFIGNNAVQFTLGHLQSLIKPKASLEEAYKKRGKNTGGEFKSNTKEKFVMDEKFETCNKNVDVQQDNKNMMVKKRKVDNEEVSYYSGKDVSDPKIVNSDSPKSNDALTYNLDANQESYCKMILKIPPSIVPQNRDELNIIFDLLEDNNPGLNTELWEITESQYKSGKFIILIDKRSVSVIKGKHFVPTLAGEKLKIALQCT